MAEYTKGEWKVQRYEKHKLYVISDYEQVAKILPTETKGIIATAEHQEANANLISAAPDMYKELLEADEVICHLCKIVNPQHATADYGKGCEWCEERGYRLKALAKAEGKEAKPCGQQ